jgi:serine/threonine-protein kinase HipA
MNEYGVWSLAPAYDLCFSLGGWCDDNQITFDGLLGQKIKYVDLINIAKKLGLKKPQDIISKVDAAIAKWKSLAKSNGVTQNQIAAIQTAINERRKSVMKK